MSLIFDNLFEFEVDETSRESFKSKFSCLFFYYLVPALLRDCSLCWDHLEVVQTPHTCQALPCCSRAGSDLGSNVRYRKGIAAPRALQFELRQSVSTSEQAIYHTQAGFEPTEAE